MADEDDLTTTDEGAAEAPSVVADAPETPGFDWGELAEHDLVKRHSGDPTKIVQSFEALQREFHARNQPQAEPEAGSEEQAWEPGQDWQAPANIDPAFYARVAANYQVDPVGTLRELVAGGDEYAVYAEKVYEALEEQVGKFRALNIYNGLLREQWQTDTEAQFSARFDEQVAPLQQEATYSRVDAGIALAKGVLGDEAWGKFEPYLRQVTDPARGGQPFPPHVIADPELTKATLLQLRDWQLFQEQKALDAASNTPAPTPTVSRRGAEATLSASSAGRPEDEDEIARIRRTTKEAAKNLRVHD